MERNKGNQWEIHHLSSFYFIFPFHSSHPLAAARYAILPIIIIICPLLLLLLLSLRFSFLLFSRCYCYRSTLSLFRFVT